jgi:hypothetical protein
MAPPLLRNRFTSLERAGTQIHLMPFEDPTTTNRGHAAVIVEDYDGILRQLHERGLRDAPRLERVGRAARVRARPGRQPRKADVGAASDPVLSGRGRRSPSIPRMRYVQAPRVGVR